MTVTPNVNTPPPPKSTLESITLNLTPREALLLAFTLGSLSEGTVSNVLRNYAQRGQPNCFNLSDRLLKELTIDEVKTITSSYYHSILNELENQTRLGNI